MPWFSISSRFHPAPTPKTKRPPEIRSIVATSFAVNVDNDLAPFERVVACGLPGVRMTSLRAEGSPEGVECFRRRAAYAFSQAFGRRQRIVTPRRLGASEPVAV